MKRALVRVYRTLARSSLRARMLLSVHDELVLETPCEQADEVRALAKREMEAAAHLDVPLTVDTGRRTQLGRRALGSRSVRLCIDHVRGT